MRFNLRSCSASCRGLRKRRRNSSICGMFRFKWLGWMLRKLGEPMIRPVVHVMDGRAILGVEYKRMIVSYPRFREVDR